MSTNRKVIIGHTINLDIKVLDALGNLVDADSAPQVQIKDGKGIVVRSLSPSGVVRLDTGRYRLSYAVPASSESGIWSDMWRTVVDGKQVENTFSFIVLSSSAELDVDGQKIGDDPIVSYTQDEICCINILLDLLRCRLKDRKGIKATVKDEYGADTLVDCPVFSDEELLCFLRASLSEFNQVPHFTDFTFADPVICDRFAHVIIEGAFILAMAAQTLIEAGREFTVTDNGITFQPPPMSSALNNNLSAFLQRHTDMLKFIKANLKPAPKGVGTFRVLAVSPAYLRLRHLRQRQII